jgi:hypothetical protein
MGTDDQKVEARITAINVVTLLLYGALYRELPGYPAVRVAARLLGCTGRGCADSRVGGVPGRLAGQRVPGRPHRPAPDDGGGDPGPGRWVRLAVRGAPGRASRRGRPARGPAVGLGLGICVIPVTSAVSAAVSDIDLGEAAAVNDAASRVEGVVVALVPALIGTTGGLGIAQALVRGYRPAMVVLAVLCMVAGAASAGRPPLGASDYEPRQPDRDESHVICRH